MVPLAVYGAQHTLGYWPADVATTKLAYRDYHTRIDWRWLMMEFATPPPAPSRSGATACRSWCCRWR